MTQESRRKMATPGGLKWGLAVAGVGAMIIYAFTVDPRRRKPLPAPVPAPLGSERKDSQIPQAAPGLTPQAAAPSAHRITSLTERLRQEGFGSELRIVRSEGGRLVSIEAPSLGGAPGRNAGREFSPQRSDQVRHRAQELLGLVEGELASLSEPVVQPGQATAQVFYRQQVEGLPVLPHGAVSVLLGPDGGLLRLESSIQGEPRVSGELRLSLEAARSQVAQALGGASVTGGTLVAWWTGDGAARRAYEFYAQGRQIVIDAQDGEILSDHDRRRF